MPPYIETDAVSARYRTNAVDVPTRRLLITRIAGSEQEQDLTCPPNCGGYGRIRHFRRETSTQWPPNPLPIEPACHALGIHVPDAVRAQVFQNAVCNWRCWYCFVPFNLLAGSPRHSAWFTAEELVELYTREPDRPFIIDLTGGQPDLVPEWVPWMMTALRAQGLEQSVYLWSDDNLSNDYLWQYTTEAQRELMATYAHYGRVCCFKGYNAESFTLNTRAHPDLFERQFALMGRLLTLGLDTYAYVTFTTPSVRFVTDDMRRFCDRLQALDPNLPLRTIPLEILPFTPVHSRLHQPERDALLSQHEVIEAWLRELESRYPAEERLRSIAEVPVGSRTGR